MIELRYLLLIIFTILPALNGQSRKFEFRELPKDSLLIIAKEIVETHNTCTFITVDSTNKPQARTVAYFPPEDDWTIWLGTFPKSRKVKQLKNNPNVMVFFYDPEGRSYVSIEGSAKLVNDSELKKKYWKEGWKVYYPDPEKDYILIEVKPKRMEICSYKHKLFWDNTGKPSFVEFN